MKATELKLRLVNGINDLVDVYFGSGNMGDRFINATMKILVKQNTYKLDNILNIFMDENGEIDPKFIVEEYTKAMGNNGVILDLRDFIHNDIAKSLLPDKALIIKAEDIAHIVNVKLQPEPTRVQNKNFQQETQTTQNFQNDPPTKTNRYIQP